MSAPAIIAKQIEPEKILQRYTNGEEMHEIAAELGVSERAVYLHVVKHDEDAWKSAQVARAIADFEEARRENKDAESMLQVARAREHRKQAEWTLEKLFRRLFGADPAVAIQINEYTARPTEQLVDELRELLKK